MEMRIFHSRPATSRSAPGFILVIAHFPSSKWTFDHAAHLLARAGFGGTPGRIKSLHELGMENAVESLLEGADGGGIAGRPAWTGDPRPVSIALRMEQATPPDEERKMELRKQAGAEDRDRMRELRGWWLSRMRYGGDPLGEKMTLFWHGHFATSNAKVQYPYAMWRQNEMLRTHALGDLRTLLVEISRDPAMIRWLDLNKSSRKEPNENFGRELLELFTLGEGHYTEADVKAAARAFTGHRIALRTGSFEFARKAHDRGEKRFIGQSGPFDGEGIIDIVLEQPQCSRFIAGRVWEFFVHPDPSPSTVDATARILRQNRHELKPLLRSIFTSEAFYSDRTVRACIKSPVQWMVQTCIELDTELPRQPVLDGALAQLGQLPFAPPNVRGWEGGRSWVSTSTLVLRYNLAAYLTGLANLPGQRRSKEDPPTLDVTEFIPRKIRNDPQEISRHVVARLFGSPNLPRMRERAMAAMEGIEMPISDDDLRRLLKNLMSTPDFQLT